MNKKLTLYIKTLSHYFYLYDLLNKNTFLGHKIINVFMLQHLHFLILAFFPS